MSGPAVEWATRQRAGGPGPKAVLLVIASMARSHPEHGDTADEVSCWPSQATIAAVSEASASSVLRHLRTLEDAGLIRREPRYRDDGARTSDRYVMSLTKAARPPHRDTPPSPTMTGAPSPTMTPEPVTTNLEGEPSCSYGAGAEIIDAETVEPQGAPRQPALSLVAALSVETVEQRTNRLARAYYDARGGMCKFEAVRGVVRAACRSSGTAAHPAPYRDDEISDALLRLAAVDAPLTMQILGAELDRLPSRRSGTLTSGRGTTDDRVMQALALANRLEAAEGRQP